MADEQDKAEALDDDKHDADFPPDQPQGVDDPTQDDRVEDDVATRALREEPDFGERTTSAADEPLIQPLVGEDEARVDDEKDLVAEAEPAQHNLAAESPATGRDTESDGAPPAAEEVAMHVEPEPDVEV